MQFNLDSIELDHRNETIFYVGSGLAIYRDFNMLVCSKCDTDSVLYRTKLPIDYVHYEFLDLGTSVLLVFAGKHVIQFYKDGSRELVYDLDPQKVGVIVTNIVSLKSNILFGTKLHNKSLQFVAFDIEQKKKHYQTSSSDFSKITDFIVTDEYIFSVMDHVIINCYSKETGQLLWARYEMNNIDSSPVIYKDRLLYSCQGMLKLVYNREYEVIQLPARLTSGILGLIGDKLYTLCNNRKNICQYNLKTKELEWEIIGTVPIKSALIVDGFYENKFCKCMIAFIKNYVGFINLSSGNVVEYTEVAGLTSMRLTNSHLILHKNSQMTTLLESIA